MSVGADAVCVGGSRPTEVMVLVVVVEVTVAEVEAEICPLLVLSVSVRAVRWR